MKLCLFFILTVISLSLFAQESAQHPRVVELEEKLEAEASKYFSHRFPGKPFFVRVSVNPLRVDVKKGGSVENLPYLEFETEENVDEWDDPTVPLTYLRNRVKKVMVDVSVNDNMSDAELQEIKDSLNVFLKLMPYRDEIKVERKLSTQSEIPQLFYYVSGLILVTLLGIGFWVRSSVKVSGATVASASAGPVSAGSGGGSVVTSGSIENNLNVKNVPPIRGDINFFDPIKLLEVLHLKINQVASHPGFPSLKDIILFDRFAEQFPGELGALVGEFPVEKQKLIFQNGRSQKWLEAFAFPTQVDQRCFQLLEEMNRSRSLTRGDQEWEKLLTQLWRLDDKLVSFLKEINQDHAFVILAQLPKQLSLTVGKKVFPGNWGRILEDRPGNVIIEPGIVKDYIRKSALLKPQLDYTLIEAYKREKEILEYVRTASIEDERDIYETLPAESFILKTRNPFYKVFELDEAQFKSFSEQFGHNDWALALINSSRQYIRRYTDTLDEKKKYVFSVALKRLDEQGSQFHQQMMIKEKMADQFKQMMQTEHNGAIKGQHQEYQSESKTA